MDQLGRAGAVSVLRQGVRVLSDGNILCLSPDGPKGPRMRIHDGILYFAKMAGVPIVPVCFSTSRPWFQKRWDRYLIAKPFGHIKLDIGKTIYIDKDTNMETAREQLEKIMVKQLQNLDAGLGHQRIEQGDIKKKK